MVISYDGSDYSGWQWQPERRTIQGTLERALESVTGQFSRITASGRTDAGVHAVRQVASCQVETRLPDPVLCRAVNANLPFDIRVFEIATVSDDFHAIRSATGKRYRYVVQDVEIPNVFRRNYSWHVPQPLDVPCMAEAAAHLMGTHDFTSFESSGAPRQTPVRTLREVKVVRQPVETPVVTFELEADGFLYNMVRIIVGTLVQVGRHKEQPEWVRHVLTSRNRRLAGKTAPAQGLFLLNVFYGQGGCEVQDSQIGRA